VVKVLFIIDFFKKRPAVLVFIATFLIYSPLLFNGYVADDSIIIEKNTFYHSWKNIPRALGEGSVFNFGNVHILNGSLSDLGTGKDSYRPISNLTYFFDYYLFHAKPYGSHLINILIHGVNSVLVYWIVNQIFSLPILGVFAGLLFSLHPIQSEAVTKMSIRADVLSAMFVLWSFYFWINFRQGEYSRKKYYCASLAMYFLAVFSKETAFILPLIIFLFDRVLVSPHLGLRQRSLWYIGFVPIFIFFLFLYFIVFPSPLATPNTFHWLGGSFLNHGLIMGYIWCSYLMNILMPWTVKMIPVHYCPPVPGLVSLATAEIGIAIMFFITGICMLWRNCKECIFFMLWYMVFYLPISNLIPIANPMAYHYMYLPSIGLLIVLSFFLQNIFKADPLKKYSQNLRNILYVTIIIFCATKTFFLNDDWKSDSDIGFAWIRDYPTDYEGYSLIGEQYFGIHDFKKAKEYFEKSVLWGDPIPYDILSLARCYMRFGQFSAAESLLKQIILRYPIYNQQAQQILEKLK